MDITVNTMKEIFGQYPINHLSQAGVLAKHKDRNTLFFIAGLTAIGIGVYIGYKVWGDSSKKELINMPNKKSKLGLQPINRVLEEFSSKFNI